MAESLQSRIEDAIGLGDTHAIVARIKDELSASIREGRLTLADRFHQTRSGAYARRLLFANPALGYTAVVMTWAPGQATAVHDHAGIWCVEGVVEGEMDVVQYELESESGGLYRFSVKGRVHAGVGSAGCLIPPYEHHVLANAIQSPSITLHIYGGEITRCNVYLPRGDGWFERQERTLHYDE